MSGPVAVTSTTGGQLERFLHATQQYEFTRNEVETLSHSEEVELFEKQLTLLRRRVKHLYVSVWYIGAGLLWFPILFLICGGTIGVAMS